MAKTDNLTDFLTDVADAIREKKGTSNPINPQDFSSEIASIQSGGGEFSWDFSRIGYTSENTTLLQQFEDAIAYSEEKARTFTPSNARLHFKTDKRLMFVPMVDTSGVTDMSGMFNDCSSLISIPQLDTSNVTNMDSMFSATALAAIPQLDTSNVTNMSNMFYSCKLISIPQLNTSKVTNISNMFYNCPNLTTIPQLDTKNVIIMNGMFQSCPALTAIPQLDTSNVKQMNSMFSSCTALTTIPLLDTSSATGMAYMFGGCSSLTTIPQLDMGEVTKMSNMFKSCSKLVFAIIKNIGKSSLATFDFSGATNWGTGGDENRQSLIDSLITYSYDRASNGMDTATITLSANTKALLTEEEIAQIAAKGYTIA